MPPCCAARQLRVTLSDFEHFASRDGIGYFRGNSAGVLSTVVPMCQVLNKLLAHCRTSPDRPPRPIIARANYALMTWRIRQVH
jgi:hypothetical protein